MVSYVFFEYSFDKMFEKKNLKLIFFVLYVIVIIRVGKGMFILLWCILNWLLLFYFIFLKGMCMKINFFYNFFNCVLDVNLWKYIVVSCYYFLLFEIKLIIIYWIF